MEPLVVRGDEGGAGLILCCECGLSIQPNAANMCVACIRSRIDITEDIPKQNQKFDIGSRFFCLGRLYSCRFCERYLLPPNAWIRAELESKELLSLALKKIKSTLQKVRLVDASFIWTEPHSKRIKVKLTIQKEVLTGAILQQTFVIEYVVLNQMCEDCRKVEAKDYWRACVQIRQKCDFKKTLFYLEQLLLKYGAHTNTTGIKPVSTGIDFYYAKLQDARKLVDFVVSVLPCKYQYAQELISHDTKNSTYDYKHTFCVEVVPVCKDNVICLPRKIAQSLGNMNQFVVCLRVNNVITIIDPSTLQLADINAQAYYRHPFESLCQPKQFTEFYVLDVEDVVDLQREKGHGRISSKHRLVDVWVARADQVGKTDAPIIFTRSHLGNVLKPGDTVLGFDLQNSNVNNKILDSVASDRVPDVILVRKVFDRTMRQKRRKWKLKRIVRDGNIVPDTASVENEFENFMEDLEEDEQLRKRINIYKKTDIVADDDEDYDIPFCPSVGEMLEDLDLNDVEMVD
ncbi:unnamed protein product [Dracunculus medinensis]|uniref:60S ribosomal export protein NMD3 n=1 Tax=Dracunculus medinensis TaxID=318479 RepID=A0A0N4UFI9_DRAME|nr:unnamed protein product [Dracunculus medinensis]